MTERPRPDLDAIDPFDLVVECNPVPEPAALPSSASAVVDRIRFLVRRRRRRQVTAAVAAVALATAAAAFVLSRHASDPNAISCFATADLSADRVGLLGEPDPIEACRQALPAPVPDSLVACVLETGGIGVLPGKEPETACSRLGLSPYTPRTTDVGVASLQTALSDAYLASPCLAPADAERVAMEQLAAVGLRDWSVIHGTDVPAGESRPCAGFSVEASTSRVLIVPMKARP